MGSILGSGEVLHNGHALWSEDRRFMLAMQEDGNLVLYCHSVERRIALWASRTDGEGPSYYARMHPRGILYIENDPVTDGIKPYIFHRPFTGLSPRPRWPGAWLAVQDDGNVVIYRQGPAKPGSSIWATDTVVPNRNRDLVAPGIETVELKAGVLAVELDHVFTNDTDQLVAVRDGSNYVTLPPSANVGIARAGDLAISVQTYEVQGDTTINTLDAFPIQRVPSSKRDIRLTQVGSKLALTLR